MLGPIDVLFRVGTMSGLSDEQLLDRFTDRHDEVARAAFTTLVERHGPMVLRVCDRVLNNPHDAQDAFQATFLVLMRKVKSVRRRDSVAAWLYGVARRVSSHARAAEARRKAVEQAARHVPEVTAALGIADLELDIWDEVDRLPDVQRAAVVLCYLDGLTHEQAAQRLGWPVGTLRSRLARARERLRGRLERRGFAPAVLGPSAGLCRPEPILLPTNLIHSTVRAALTLAARDAIEVGSVSSSAAALTEGVLQTMLIAKLKSTAAVLVAASALILGAAVYGYQPPGDVPKKPIQSLPPSAATGTEGDFENSRRATRRVTAEQIEALVQQARRFQEQGDLAQALQVLDDVQKLTRVWAGLLVEPVRRRGSGPGQAIPGGTPLEVRPLDTGRRLGEVEHKLDRILKLLEGTNPARTDQR